jgi:hypothetical protein
MHSAGKMQIYSCWHIRDTYSYHCVLRGSDCIGVKKTVPLSVLKSVNDLVFIENLPFSIAFTSYCANNSYELLNVLSSCFHLTQFYPVHDRLMQKQLMESLKSKVHDTDNLQGAHSHTVQNRIAARSKPCTAFCRHNTESWVRIPLGAWLYASI